jgi:hypothetical protein
VWVARVARTAPLYQTAGQRTAANLASVTIALRLELHFLGQRLLPLSTTNYMTRVERVRSRKALPFHTLPKSPLHASSCNLIRDGH